MQWLNTEMGRQITKDQFTERIVRPFACATATLAHNFITPNSWMHVNKQNLNFYKDNTMFSDFFYKNVSKCAKKLQDRMWGLAPVYKDFSRGWKSK